VLLSRVARPGLLAGLLLPAALAAQERIALRAVPAPNQVIRISMTQTMALDVTMEGLAIGPLKMDGQMGISGTQRVGARDAQGRVSSALTVDEVTMDMKLNGVSQPAPEGVAQLKGQRFTVVYDAEGKIVDVSVPAGLGQAGVTAKSMITSLAGSIPSTTLGIGDTVTVQLSIPVPTPVPGMDAGQPTMLETRITSKLVAIGRDGSDRIADLEQTTAGKATRTLDLPSPSGMVSADLQLGMTGNGTLQLNVDKGFVKSGNSDMKLDMTVLTQGTSIKVNGTIHLVVTGTAER
jgi:hypothetical protein